MRALFPVIVSGVRKTELGGTYLLGAAPTNADDDHTWRCVREHCLLVTFFADELVWKACEIGRLLVLVAPHHDLRSVVVVSLFDLLDSFDVCVPGQFPSAIEGPLEERADPVQLSAVDRESARKFVRVTPVLALTILATVEGRRLFAMHIDAVSTRWAAVIRRSGTGCTRVDSIFVDVDLGRW